MMFNSTKLKTRPANYGASLSIDPEEETPDEIPARAIFLFRSPSFSFSDADAKLDVFKIAAAVNDWSPNTFAKQQTSVGR
jgi:hypothetical protein